jgi:hypothetical protein
MLVWTRLVDIVRLPSASLPFSESAVETDSVQWFVDVRVDFGSLSSSASLTSVGTQDGVLSNSRSYSTPISRSGNSQTGPTFLPLHVAQPFIAVFVAALYNFKPSSAVEHVPDSTPCLADTAVLHSRPNVPLSLDVWERHSNAVGRDEFGGQYGPYGSACARARVR